MEPNRLSSTPLYDSETIEEFYTQIDSRFMDPEDLRAPLARASALKVRSFQTKYLNKRHRFFRAKVTEEHLQSALEAVEEKLKELTARHNGDLHVCKASGKDEITVYYIVNDEVSDSTWADELNESISFYLKEGAPLSLLELQAMK